jgi:hypothetical protein
VAKDVIGFGIVIGIALAGLVPAGRASAQASFSESFDANGPTNPGADGPATLVSRGWIFRNQSQPLGGQGWFDGYPPPYLVPQAGAGYLAIDASSTDSTFGGDVSNWAILPAIPSQTAGDVVTIHATQYGPWPTAHLEIRYSANGGTSTGSTRFDVGDFSQLLFDVNPLPSGGWQEITVAAPGSGRLALRYLDHVVAFSGGAYAGVDTLTVGAPQQPPCNSPPMPGAGQSVTWSASGSPYQICSNVSIPTGATVLVDPGVQVNVDAGMTLSVLGSLVAHGVAGNPVTIAGSPVSSITPPLRVFGTLDAQFADLSGVIVCDSGGTVQAYDCRFSNGTLQAPEASIIEERRLVDIRRSSFDSAGISMSDVVLALRSCTFLHCDVFLNRGYVLVDDLAFDGGQLWLMKDIQPVYLNNITVRNSPGAGLRLSGSQRGNDYFIGSNVVLENNLYPVELREGGILPGSVIAPTGNVNDYILGPGVGDIRGPFTWADAGVPYVITGYAVNVGGPWNFLPGATVKFQGTDIPGIEDHSGFSVRARGLPGRPVTFEGFDPSLRWYGLVDCARFEHCVIDGAQGVGFLDWGLPKPVDSCVIRNNGAFGGPVTLRSSDLIGNDVAIARQSIFDTGWDLSGRTNPNSFVGNVVGVQVAQDATWNWWGSPTGPTSPQNPGGVGDSADPGVPVIPFRTTPPDRSDSPPVVTLHQPSFLLDPGDKVMLTWDVEDDHAVASQRVLFSPAGNAPQFYSVVADNLPGTQRALEFTVPHVGLQQIDAPASLRIVAVDSVGQEAFDEWNGVVPSEDVAGTASITTDLTGPFVADQRVPFCWDLTGTDFGFGLLQFFFFIDGDDQVSGGESVVNPGCLPTPLRMPQLSSDTVRYGLRIDGTCCNRVKWFFSDPFTVRLDPRLGDAPPTVAMTTPLAGDSFPASGIVPITWTASDDEGVRSFGIQASYNRGRTWHWLVKDLPGTTTSYFWRTAPGTGFADVRVRVIAKDLRFQNSSDGGTRSFSITPTPSLYVTTSPLATSVAAGDRLVFDVEIGNTTDQSRTVDAWIDGILPNGHEVGTNPLVGPRSLTLAPHRIVRRTVRLRVPPTVRPSGPYTLRASIGTHPAPVVDSASFSFVVR